MPGIWLTSANSINIGRLMPQCVYYAAASLDVWRRTGQRANFIVPTGNLGNGFAAIWTRAFGLPIGDIVLSTNINRTIADYLVSGDWRPQGSVATLASAMDVGDPEQHGAPESAASGVLRVARGHSGLSRGR